DLFPEALAEIENPEFRITLSSAQEIIVVVKLLRGHLVEFGIEQDKICLLNPNEVAEAAFDRCLEIAVRKDVICQGGCTKLHLGVALWHGGLPVDILPASGLLEVSLGEENFAWPLK